VDDWQRVVKKIDGLHAELDGTAFNKRLAKVGKDDLVPIVEKSIRRDAGGDLAMSGWRTKKGDQLQLTAHSEPAASVPTGIFISPAIQGANWRKGHGPMRVLQDGRKSYVAGDRRRKGHRVKKKTGEVVDTFRKVKRNIGATRGKGTWSDAVAEMNRVAAKRVDERAVKDALKKYWG
jgi:hypothetical protein